MNIKCVMAFLLSCAAFCADAQVDTSRLGVGDSVRPFTVKDVRDAQINFPADFKGKIVVVNFWATWCRPCMLEQSEIVATMKEHGRAPLAVLGVSMDYPGMLKKVLAAMDLKGMTWPQIYPAPESIAAAYGANSGIPLTFLVDADTGLILTGNVSANLSAAVDAAVALKKSGAKLTAPLPVARSGHNTASALTPEERKKEQERMVGWYNKRSNVGAITVDGAPRAVKGISATTHGVPAEMYLAFEGGGLDFDLPVANGSFPTTAMFDGNYASIVHLKRGEQEFTAGSWDSNARQFMKTSEGLKPGSGQVSLRYTVAEEFSGNVVLYINGTFESVLRTEQDAGEVRTMTVKGSFSDVPFMVSRLQWEASSAYQDIRSR